MPQSQMTYEEAVAGLERRGFGINPGLERIEALAGLLNHPERTYPVVHVAGTNGKSSTVRMIGAILAAHGIKAGVYTSPHLQSVRERFLLVGPQGSSIAGNYVSPDEFAEVASYLQPFVEQVENDRGEEVTYFEMTTAIAFELFAQMSAGVGVIETGMGGTWDATNVVRPDVAVITHVGLDHTNFLGSTALEIAREKAGIIKPGAVVVSGAQDPGVLELLNKTAREKDSPLSLIGRDFHLRADRLALEGRVITVQGLYQTYEDVFLALHGAHQSANACLAVAACESFLGRALNLDSLTEALAAVTSPGRMEVAGKHPLVILDGAHNPEGAVALASALAETFGRKNATFVIALSRDKDAEGILRSLLPLAARVVFTASTEKPADPEMLAGLAAGKVAEIEVIPDIPAAIDRALQLSGSQDMVVVTGSLYAIGPAREHLAGRVS